MTVIRCVSCGLRQFALSSTCRRCHADLGFSMIEIPLLMQDSSHVPRRNRLELILGPAIRSLRLRQGKSQARVASNAYIERSNLSRIERNQSTPNLLTFARALSALGVESLCLRLSKTASRPQK